MARPVQYRVALTESERENLIKNTKSGKWVPQEVKRAKILLKADTNGNFCWEEKKIAKHVGCSISTVKNIKLRFCKKERLKAVKDKPRSGRPKIVDGEIEAHIVATACSAPPEGRTRWTIQLISDKIAVLEEGHMCSKTTVGRTLKKINLSLG